MTNLIEGPGFREWLESNPEMRGRLDAIGATLDPSPRIERSRKVPASTTDEIRRTAQELDRPQATHKRKRGECTDHQFYLRDRCFYCGIPGEIE